MYGPLNGVRAALVVAAFVTAIISALLGHGVAAGYLLGAVAVHGIGWRYLHRRHIARPPTRNTEA
jgi:hypothetical protein